MHSQRFVALALTTMLLLAACGGGGSNNAASSASTSSTSSSSSSSQSPKAKKAAEDFQAARKTSNDAADKVFQKQQQDYAAQDLVALQEDESKFRDIDFGLDKTVRDIDFPANSANERNAFLEANSAFIAAEDAVRGAADVAMYHRLDRKALRVGVARSEATFALLRKLGAPDPKDPGQPKAAAKPGGTVVFTDDFADPTSGWSRGSNPQGTFDYKDGAYELTVSAPDASVLSDSVLEGTKGNPKLEALDNVSVSVSVTKEQDVGGNAGLACHEDALAKHSYVGLVDTTGDWVIGRIDGTSFTELDNSEGSATRGVSSEIKESGANEVRIDCVTKSGTVTVTLSVNGKQLAQGSDTKALPPGAVAMVADSTVPLCCNTVLFDDIEIRDLG